MKAQWSGSSAPDSDNDQDEMPRRERGSKTPMTQKLIRTHVPGCHCTICTTGMLVTVPDKVSAAPPAIRSGEWIEELTTALVNLQYAERLIPSEIFRWINADIQLAKSYVEQSIAEVRRRSSIARVSDGTNYK